MTRMIRTTGLDATATTPCTLPDRWRADRLREARGILADIPQHRETLVILAARVVAWHSADAIEAANARDLWRRPAAVAQATCPKGGAA